MNVSVFLIIFLMMNSSVSAMQSTDEVVRDHRCSNGQYVQVVWKIDRREEETVEAHVKRSLFIWESQSDRSLLNNVYDMSPLRLKILLNQIDRDMDYGRKRLMFTGTSGVGKTELARAIAHRLNMPYHRVSSYAIEDVYEYSGSRNIKKIFELMRRERGPKVLILDGFEIFYYQGTYILNALYEELDKGDRDILVIGILCTNATLSENELNRLNAENIHISPLTTQEEVENVFNYHLGDARLQCDASEYFNQLRGQPASFVKDFVSVALAQARYEGNGEILAERHLRRSQRRLAEIDELVRGSKSNITVNWSKVGKIAVATGGALYALYACLKGDNKESENNQNEANTLVESSANVIPLKE